MNDWELLRQYVETRSQPAFAQLVERHVRWVHSACARQLRDVHLAEDVTQAVFLLLAQKAARLKPQASITGWLFRTARLMSSNAIKMHRRRMRRDTRAAAAAEEAYRARERNDAAATKSESELLLALDTAMVRLRAQDRDVLLLRFYGNKSVAEVAQELNISLDAAKKRFARSLDALRQALAEQGVTVPAAGAAMMILSAVAPTTSKAVPATLSNWIAAGASPATASARASEIVRRAGMKQLLTAALACAVVVLAIAAASMYAWPTRTPTASPAVAAAPSPRSTAPTTASTTAPATAPTGVSPAPNIQQFAGHTTWITAASMSSDGRYAASRSANQLLRWDLASGTPIGPPVTIREQPLGLAISPGGKMVAVDRADLLFFDTFDAASPRRLSFKTGKLLHWSLAITSAGDKIADGGADGVIRMIDPTSDVETAALRGHAGVVSVVAFAPDGRTLLSGGWDHSVRLWDLASGTELSRFDGHTSAIHGVAFSGDGTRAISFARSMTGPKSRDVADPAVRVWDLKDEARHMTLPVRAPVVHAVACTPDGQRAVALVDRELFVWDLTDGRLIEQRTVLPQTTIATCAVFSRDCRQLLVGGEGKLRNVLLKVDLGGAGMPAGTRK